MKFSSAFMELDNYLVSHLDNITCHEIFKIKDDFYQSVASLCGSTTNLTGITELLIYRLIYHALKMEGPIDNKSVHKKDIRLLIGTRYKGKNGKNQEPDIIIEQNDKIKFLFSIKNVLAKTTSTNDEKVSSLVNELIHLNQGYTTAIQDLFRIDNIRHGINKDFNSITIVYSKPLKTYEESLKIIKQKFDWHNFLILEDNHSLFITELNKNLCSNINGFSLSSIQEPS